MTATVTLSGYVQAVLRARARLLALDVEAVRGLVQAVDTYARDLERALARLPSGDAAGRSFLRSALQANRRLSLDLQRALVRITDKNVELSFAEVTKLLQKASIAALGASEAATLGITSIAPLEAAAAYLARHGTATTFASLTAHAAAVGTREVDRIIASAVGVGTDPMTLARHLRQYVQGSESLQGLAKNGVIRMSDIPRELQGAGRLMEFNARRIALTEMGNAAHEAEVRQFALTPQVRAVKWMLAPNRGKLNGTDECDMLAKTDFYGMGAGVYPVNKVPAKPHPFCRCWLLPVMAERVNELNERKPNPARDPNATTTSPALAGLSRAQRDRLVASTNDKVVMHTGPGGVKDQLGLPAKARVPIPAPIPDAPPVLVMRPSYESLGAQIGRTEAWKAATSLAEADTFARDTLGLRSNYDTFRSTTLVNNEALLANANYLNEALLRLKRLDYAMPEAARLEAGSASGAYAWYTPREKSITLNIRTAPFSRGPGSLRAAEERASWMENGALASDHPFGVVYHEYGHFFEHTQSNSFVGTRLSRRPLSESDLRELYKRKLIGPHPALPETQAASGRETVEAWRDAVARGGMSQYGVSMQCEFIAETLSRVFARQHVDDFVIQIYFKLGGPEIPGLLTAPVRVTAGA